ncbi:Uncharacterised protein [Mycobacteroides abscessus subsp. abscessus]|nr:Uncharacterised protein [Mycobacteroides abscessus subsp. abscessus]
MIFDDCQPLVLRRFTFFRDKLVSIESTERGDARIQQRKVLFRSFQLLIRAFHVDIIGVAEIANPP